MTVKIQDIYLIVLSIFSGGVVAELKESMIFPIRNTKEGIPSPAKQEVAHPMYIRHISPLVAKEYNFEYLTPELKFLLPPVSLVMMLSTCLRSSSRGSYVSAT
jgi:hypothetical protein